MERFLVRGKICGAYICVEKGKGNGNKSSWSVCWRQAAGITTTDFFLTIVPFFCDSRKVQKEDRTPLQDSYMQYKVSDCQSTPHPTPHPKQQYNNNNNNCVQKQLTALSSTSFNSSRMFTSKIITELNFDWESIDDCAVWYDSVQTTVGTTMTVSKLLWAHPWQCLNYCGHILDSVWTTVGTPMTVSKLCDTSVSKLLWAQPWLLKLLWAHPWQCLNYCGHTHDRV